MNIKDWKQFSELVDDENYERWKKTDKLNKEFWEEQKTNIKSGEIFVEYPMFGAVLIKKTLENYYEWKIGKLKL